MSMNRHHQLGHVRSYNDYDVYEYDDDPYDYRTYRAPSVEPDTHRRRVWWWLIPLCLITTIVAAEVSPPLFYFLSTCWLGLLIFWLFISGHAVESSEDNFIDRIF